jgi:hypothetical protein
LGFKFLTGGRGEGGPRRAEKNFYLYISREGKEPLKHVFEPLRAQVHRWELEGCGKLRSVQFSFVGQKWAI